MARIIYTPEQKTRIMESAAAIGATAAAKENGVSYATVLKWMKETKDTVSEKAKDISAGTVKAINGQISSLEQEIADLTQQLNEKKAELKTLQKAREKAEKLAAKEKDAAETKKLVNAIMKSGKSVEEVLTLLNS